MIAGLLIMADRGCRVLQRQFDRWWIPRDNRRLATRTISIGQLNVAIDRAINWFAVLPGLEFGTITLLKPELDAGMEPKLAFVNHFLGCYASRFDNPELRLFDAKYKTGAEEHRNKQRVGSNHAINDVMFACVNATSETKMGPLFDQLRALEDRGMYGTTHIIWGALVLRHIGAASKADTESLIQRATPVMIARQEWDRCCDHFAERILFLQWTGQHEKIDPAWIHRLLEGQREDGGWQRHPTLLPTRSIQHTTALALAVLIIMRAHIRDGFDGAFWAGDPV